MASTDKLFLHEEITLLALRDKEGTFQIGVGYDYAVGGAVLAELLLHNRISVEECRKKKLVNLVDSKPFGDSIIDECLEKVRCAGRRASLQSWVSRFAGVKKLRPRIGGELCKRGILRADEKKILWIFSQKIYPEVNPVPEEELIGRMREAIFTDAEDMEPRTVIIISLAKSADLLKTIFDKGELKNRKDRIERIVNGELAGKATKEAIEAMQAAIFITTILPAITATTITR